MANLITLPALGVALFVATGTGLYLGESSIGLIKPVYFQGPAIHPRDRGAAVDPNAVRPREPAFSELYGWVEGDAALRSDCGDCDALRSRDAYAHSAAYSAVVPYFGSDEEARPLVHEAVVEPQPYVQQARSSAADISARIERYARYPVSEDEKSVDPDDSAGAAYVGRADLPAGQDGEALAASYAE